jgi:hypothetical protein
MYPDKDKSPAVSSSGQYRQYDVLKNLQLVEEEWHQVAWANTRWIEFTMNSIVDVEMLAKSPPRVRKRAKKSVAGYSG